MGEVPVSGMDECAVFPSNTVRVPREAQLTTPVLSRTSPNGTPGDAISPSADRRRRIASPAFDASDR
ncbi:hypothetical protein [Mesorhizobium sp.]|uniref:hypothetical protein n=1 Tax=Mesorhizobium sp. TaxID=1871066 RepID=UPI0025BD166A|nr:hypothetical protein [Mesorhizobium sp.]